MNDLTQRTDATNTHLLKMSCDIIAAYVGRNALPPDRVGALIQAVHTALAGLGGAPSTPAPAPQRQKPAVPISRSVFDDHIVCLEDGKHLKMLKRYLRARFGMSPEDYRRKWGLPLDYPMVAPIYAERRSHFAKQMGLGKGVRGRKGSDDS